MPNSEKFEKGIPPEKLEKLEELPEKEIKLEEGARLVKKFVKLGFEERMESMPEVLKKKYEEVEKFLLTSSPSKLEKILGEREFQLILDRISDFNALKKEIFGEINKKEFHYWGEEKGDKMLPRRFREFKEKLISYESRIYSLIDEAAELNMGMGNREILQVLRERSLKELEESQLKEELRRWRAYFEAEEEPIQFENLEKLKTEWKKILGNRGEKLFDQAMEIIPWTLFSKNVKKIKYSEIPEIVMVSPGVAGVAEGSYDPETQEIGIPKTSLAEGTTLAEEFPFRLFHELGHSLDPRLVDQKDLPLWKQLVSIKDWERTRDKEPSFSNYVKLITSEFKLEENCYKSEEDWADSIAYYFSNPSYLQEIAPERYEFVDLWLGERLPGLDKIRDKISEGLDDYFIRLYYLEE